MHTQHGAILRAMGDEELVQRLLAVAPALTSLLQGLHPVPVDKLPRDVALHSEAAGLDVSLASERQLRVARRGPHLGSKRPELESSQELDINIEICNAEVSPSLDAVPREVVKHVFMDIAHVCDDQVKP